MFISCPIFSTFFLTVSHFNIVSVPRFFLTPHTSLDKQVICLYISWVKLPFLISFWKVVVLKLLIHYIIITIIVTIYRSTTIYLHLVHYKFILTFTLEALLMKLHLGGSIPCLFLIFVLVLSMKLATLGRQLELNLTIFLLKKNLNRLLNKGKFFLCLSKKILP